MFGILRCKHPANMLGVEKDQTVEQCDIDFDYVTYHFHCCKCSQKVKIKYAKFRGGVSGFLARQPDDIPL